MGNASSSSHEISVITANTNEEKVDAAVNGKNSVEDEDEGNEDEEEEEEEEEDDNEEEYGRDREMEEYIAGNITGDQLAAYDLDIELEGKALFEYLDMLKSRMNE